MPIINTSLASAIQDKRPDCQPSSSLHAQTPDCMYMQSHHNLILSHQPQLVNANGTDPAW